MQLGWIDFSKEDRDKVHDVMNLLQEQGAVDELGIGIIRDAFANYFFPGTSTIQTRAKYFLIVPYLLKEAAEGKYGTDVNKILRRIEQEEKQCGITLLNRNPEADGIVGKRVLPKGWVSRKPSDIYWNGIRTYGIFRKGTLSIKEYLDVSMKMKEHKNLMKFGNREDDALDSDKDDKDAGDMVSFQLWDIPTYTTDWKEYLQIELTQNEAVFLRQRIEKSRPCSLLAYILKNRIDVNEYDGFGALTIALKDQVESDTADMMELACDFNNLVYMARVRYNIMLSGGKNELANDEWTWLSDNLKINSGVDLNSVFGCLQINNPKTYNFLVNLQEYFANGNIEEADNLIRKREIQLKGVNRAKLSRVNEYPSDSWVGGMWLDYRFADAKRIINDIYHGEVISIV